MNKTDKITKLSDYGKIPPQAIDLEMAVLGAVMLEKNAIYMVSSFLTSEMFYNDAHKTIYQAVIDLQLIGVAIDVLTVTEQLRKKQDIDTVGGEYYLSRLMAKVSSAAHIDEHARIIEQKYLQREVIRITSEFNQSAYDSAADVSEIIDSITLQIMNINKDINNEPEHIKYQAEKNIDHLHELILGKEQPYGIKTKLAKLDLATNGIQKDLIIIAARPGMGKTSFTIQLANNIAIDQQIPTALFELEMNKERVVRWMVAQRTGIHNDLIKKGKGLEKEEINQIEIATHKIMQSELYIDDTAALNIIELRSKAIRLKQQHNIELIIIDYLQLMKSVNRKNSREEEVSEISRGLKQLQKELDLPVIALSQLNRKIEERTDKRPKLSDLRESGSIEQDSDTVIFLNRPEKNGESQCYVDDEEIDSTGVAELFFAKHRDGENDTVVLRFNAKTVSFENFENNDPDKWINN